MTILTHNAHTGFMYMLASSLHDQQFDVMGSWDIRQRPLPKNVKMVTLKSAILGLLNGKYQTTIFHRQLQDYHFLALSLLSAAKTILIFHGKYTRKGSNIFLYSAAKRLFHQLFICPLVRLKLIKLVFIQASAQISYNLPGAVIEPAIIPIELSEFPVSTPAAGKIAIVGNRLDRSHFDQKIIANVASQVDVDIIGNNPHLKNSSPSKSYNELLSRLSSCEIFLNLLNPPEAPYNLATLEAVELGLLVIATDHPEALIINEFNGLVIKNAEDLQRTLCWIRDNRAEALRLAETNRNYMRRRFSQSRFRQQWNELLDVY